MTQHSWQFDTDLKNGDFGAEGQEARSAYLNLPEVKGATGTKGKPLPTVDEPLISHLVYEGLGLGDLNFYPA